MSLLLKLHIHTRLNKCTHAKFICNDSFVTSGLLLSSIFCRSFFSFYFYWLETVNAFPHSIFLCFPFISRWGYGTLPTKCVSVNRIFNLAFPCKMVLFFGSFFSAHPRPVPQKRMRQIEYVPSFFRSIKCSYQHQMFVLHTLCAFLRIHAEVKKKKQTKSMLKIIPLGKRTHPQIQTDEWMSE